MSLDQILRAHELLNFAPVLVSDVPGHSEYALVDGHQSRLDLNSG